MTHWILDTVSLVSSFGHGQLFYNPMDWSPPGSSVDGIFQARILEWVAICFSRGFSQPRDQTQVSCIVGRFFIGWATREAHCVFSSSYSQYATRKKTTSRVLKSHGSTQLQSVHPGDSECLQQAFISLYRLKPKIQT